MPLFCHDPKAGRAYLMTNARNRNRNKHHLGGLLVAALVLVAGAASAGLDRASLRLLRAESELMGAAASRTWQYGRTFDQIGGEGIERDQVRDEVGGSGGDPGQDTASGSVSTGTKVTAGALSAILPGAGQFYNGEKKKAYIMAGIEVAIWTTWFVFDNQADNATSDARDYAHIFAGAGGTDENHYWRAVGRYTDSDTYNEDLARQRRSSTDPVPNDIPSAQSWQWVNTSRQVDYLKQMDDADSATSRRDFMIVFAIVNRLVSVVDAVLGAGGKPGSLEGEAMGMDLELEMLPSWRDPGARFVVSRSF